MRVTSSRCLDGSFTPTPRGARKYLQPPDAGGRRAQLPGLWTHPPLPCNSHCRAPHGISPRPLFSWPLPLPDLLPQPVSPESTPSENHLHEKPTPGPVLGTQPKQDPRLSRISSPSRGPGSSRNAHPQALEHALLSPASRLLFTQCLLPGTPVSAPHRVVLVILQVSA